MSKVLWAAELDYQLGALIRATYTGWKDYPLERRREYVRQYQYLMQQFIAVTGKNQVGATSPWTDNELDRHGYELRSTQSPLEIAVRVTERCLRKFKKLPRTLDVKNTSWVRLDKVEHGKSLADLEAIHSRPYGKPSAIPGSNEHNRNQEWLRIAERRVKHGRA